MLLSQARKRDNGTVDGQGSAWWAWSETHNLNYSRPHLVELVNSTDVVISNITFLNSPAWSIHPAYCSNVEILNITIHVPYDSPFTNGIVPDSCSKLCIEDCTISSGHDAIALKSGWDKYGITFGRPSSNIHISRVSLKTPLGSALAFGSEMSGGISNIQVDHLHIHNSKTGISLKTTRGRGGFMEDIAISNVEMDNVQVAIQLSGHSGDHPDDQYDPTAVPAVSRITIKNVVGTNVSVAGALSGIDSDPFSAICLSNITLSVSSSPPWTCSNVSGFSESVTPQPCSELLSDSPLLCYSLPSYFPLATA
ncbi:putative polygalacturonase [Iris pallida]|uniref:Polygalacturonase n=1 Tax=Iris pallida TaxID=29817 RepID=A0AAX6HTE3_IRIPA|nr:putative polygalacturonase [Iris pallida]